MPLAVKPRRAIDEATARDKRQLRAAIGRRSEISTTTGCPSPNELLEKLS